MRRHRLFCCSSVGPVLGVAVTAFVASTLSAAETRPPAEAVPGAPAILLGVAWYPEQWPEAARERDLTLFSYTSPRYRELCRRVVEEMARRFGHDPNVVGWQIGNELTEDSFDEHSQALFQEWLHARYRTLDVLNDRWATAYWSQTYDRWDEIPREGPPEPGAAPRVQAIRDRRVAGVRAKPEGRHSTPRRSPAAHHHEPRPVSVDLPRPLRNVLSEGLLVRQVELPVEGVGVLATAEE